MRRAVALTVGLLSSVATPATGQERTAVLVFHDQTGTGDCPDEQAVRDAISARLGYVPFRDEAALALDARIARAGRRLVATVQTRGPSGETRRELSAGRGECAELVDAMALVISVAIDPLALGRPTVGAAPLPAPARAPAPAPAPAAAPPAAAPPAPVTRQPAPVGLAARSRVRVPTPRARPLLSVGLGAVGSLGAAPGPTVGAVLSAGLRLSGVSVALEGRLDAAGSEDAGAGGRVDAGLRLATLVPCGHVGPLATCALLSVGALAGQGAGVEEPRSDSTLFAALGARVGVEVGIVGPVLLRGHVDLLAALTPTDLQLDGATVWSVPTLSGALGASLAGALPL